MQNLIQTGKEHPLAGFFILTYAISWIIWIPGVIAYLVWQPEGLPLWLLLPGLLGAYGPTAAALIMSYLTGGSAEVWRLLRQFGHWRVNIRWYAVALLLPTALFLAAAALYLLAGGQSPSLDFSYLTLALPIFLFALPFGPMGEEAGWRGYALPRLQQQYGPLVASLIIGVVWALWHIPVFFVPGVALSPHATVNLPTILIYMVNTTAIAVLFTWLYRHSQGSLLLAILFHGAINATGQIMWPMFWGTPDATLINGMSQYSLVVIVVVAIVAAYRMLGTSRQELAVSH